MNASFRKFLLRIVGKLYFLFPERLYLIIRYYLEMGKPLHLDDPKTMNEKLQWLKLYNRKSGLSFQVILSCGAYRTELTDDLDFEAAVRCADEKMYAQKSMHKKES